MTASSLTVGARLSLAAGDFQTLLDALAGRGYQVMGPTLEDGRLIYGEIGKVTDLPVGWTAFQAGGTFHLEPRPDQAFFGFAVGQQSWKQFLWPPHQTLYQAQREGAGFQFIPGGEAVPKFAFVGVRSCELAAMAVQDRVFLQGAHVDPTYQARREPAFIVALNCGHQDPGVCFCVSMGTGPRAAAGFDLALTEVLRGEEHFFVVEAGTMRGADLIRELPERTATPEEVDAAARLVAAVAGNMGRELDTTGIKELFYANYEHPRWDEVAARCLTCGNCTMVCPTCFCHTLEDSLDLTGAVAERRRRLDPASAWISPTARRQHPHLAAVPLPPVADPQAGHLDRPVRLFGLRRLRTLHHLVPRRHRPHRGSPGHPGVGRGNLRRSNSMETIEPILAAHPFFLKGLDSRYLKLIVECASRETFPPGKFLCQDNEEARKFYVIHHGRVAVEIYRPRRGPGHGSNDRRGRGVGVAVV